MGKAAASEVSGQLIAAGLAGDTPVALVESASLPEERQFHTRLDLLPLVARAALDDGPALLLIGTAIQADLAGNTLASSSRRTSGLACTFGIKKGINRPLSASSPSL
jgi:uroporphyrin-III C-methyltransferase